MHNLSYTHFYRMRKPKIVYVGYECLPGTERINWLVFEIIYKSQIIEKLNKCKWYNFFNFPSKVYLFYPFFSVASLQTFFANSESGKESFWEAAHKNGVIVVFGVSATTFPQHTCVPIIFGQAKECLMCRPARSSPRPQQRTHIDSRTRSMPGAPLFGKSTSRKFTLALCHQNSPSRQTNARWRVDESTAATFRQAPDTRSEEKRSNQLDARAAINKKAAN